MRNENPKYRRVDQYTRHKISMLLTEILSVEGDHPSTAQVEYKDGWSDEKVAIHFEVSEKSVEYQRIKSFGRLKPPVKASTLIQAAAIAAANAEIDARVSSLERRYMSMQDRITITEKQNMILKDQIDVLYTKLRSLLD